MKGLYKGKYLIVYYDKNGLPLFVAASVDEFLELYKRFEEGTNVYNSAYKLIERHERKRNKSGDSRIALVRADTVTKDCFEDADIDFINFLNETREKTFLEKVKELGISDTTYYRWIKIGKLKGDK